MLQWFHKLLPREEKFFDLFARHSEVVVAGAKALREMLEGGDAVTRYCKTVMDREHDADDITREVLMAVRRSFITPFDRDAIMKAASLVQEAIPLLSSISANAGRVSALTEQISQIEGHADELHDIGMQELYRVNQPANAMPFFIGAEIYDHLEKVADRFDDVANEIQGIVLENV
jgi:uncharacterized protein Yka (UPF0111/DUF47 family)